MVGAVVFGGAVKQGKAGFPTFSGKSSAGRKCCVHVAATVFKFTEPATNRGILCRTAFAVAVKDFLDHTAGVMFERLHQIWKFRMNFSAIFAAQTPDGKNNALSIFEKHLSSAPVTASKSPSTGRTERRFTAPDKKHRI